MENLPSPNDKKAFAEWQREIHHNYKVMKHIVYGLVSLIFILVIGEVIKLTFFP